jgi:hypothetical protein
MLVKPAIEKLKTEAPTLYPALVEAIGADPLDLTTEEDEENYMLWLADEPLTPYGFNMFDTAMYLADLVIKKGQAT